MSQSQAFAAAALLVAILANSVVADAVTAQTAAKPSATGNPKGGEWDDSIRSVDPKRGGVFDDSVRSVNPGKDGNPRAFVREDDPQGEPK